MDTYEVRITINVPDRACFYIDHRFASLPEPETFNLLLTEAKSVFHLLHEIEHDYCAVSVVRLAEPDDSQIGAPASVS